MHVTRILLAASASVALAACGGDGDPVAVPGPSPATSAPAADASPAPPSPSAAPADGAAATRLLGDGIELPDRVLAFGTPYDEARAALASALGEPSADTGPIDPSSPYGACPGTTLQVLEYGAGALQLLFGDVEADEPVLYQWALTGAGDASGLPRASALVGDRATFAFGPGTTVGELEDSAGEAFAPVEDELSLDPAFVLRDQSSGFAGFLSGTTPADVVTLVEAGTPCGA